MDNGHEALLENFEFNEQRMKEIEIPIFQMEQKIEKLENQFARWQLNGTNMLREQICADINLKPKENIPAFYLKIQ